MSGAARRTRHGAGRQPDPHGVHLCSRWGATPDSTRTGTGGGHGGGSARRARRGGAARPGRRGSDGERERGARSRSAMSVAMRPVVVTRAEGSEGPLSRELRGLGLKVLSWPAVSVVRADSSALEAALSGIHAFRWIVFASRHAVAAVLERLPAPPAHARL